MLEKTHISVVLQKSTLFATIIGQCKRMVSVKSFPPKIMINLICGNIATDGGGGHIMGLLVFRFLTGPLRMPRTLIPSPNLRPKRSDQQLFGTLWPMVFRFQHGECYLYVEVSESTS